MKKKEIVEYLSSRLAETDADTIEIPRETVKGILRYFTPTAAAARSPEAWAIEFVSRENMNKFNRAVVSDGKLYATDGYHLARIETNLDDGVYKRLKKGVPERVDEDAPSFPLEYTEELISDASTNPIATLTDGVFTNDTGEQFREVRVGDERIYLKAELMKDILAVDIEEVRAKDCNTAVWFKTVHGVAVVMPVENVGNVVEL